MKTASKLKMILTGLVTIAIKLMVNPPTSMEDIDPTLLALVVRLTRLGVEHFYALWKKRLEDRRTRNAKHDATHSDK
ncbi:hypothetical protein LH442_09080 [Laribacter hongkongensis]|uniref:hypothetical protein n=1 Tax=Laribacter hongkongensis TaxID=168471 RepID=UPI001EFCB7B0|nr:hypothetical protein [Laribacter hongkongensis]MCG9056144.1 hypothetical protein [Laribacter hongkongensis]